MRQEPRKTTPTRKPRAPWWLAESTRGNRRRRRLEDGVQGEPTGWQAPLCKLPRGAALSGTWLAMTQRLLQRPPGCGTDVVRGGGCLLWFLKGCLWLGLVAHIRWGVWRGGGGGGAGPCEWQESRPGPAVTA